jgi:Leucine-rich repeat (LRR) protein
MPHPDKIQALIDSGTPENIDLAFVLMESQGCEGVVLPTRKDVIEWLLSQTEYDNYDGATRHIFNGYQKELYLLDDGSELSLAKQKEVISNFAQKRGEHEIFVAPNKTIPNYIRWIRKPHQIKFYCNHYPEPSPIHFPQGFEHLNQTETVTLGALIDIPSVWKKFSGTKEIGIFVNASLTRFPETANTWDALTKLHVEQCALEYFDVAAFGKVKNIKIDFNKATQLVFDVSQENHHLEELILYANKGTISIKGSLANLKNLRSLSLESNTFESLPTVGAEMHSLKDFMYAKKQLEVPHFKAFVDSLLPQVKHYPQSR